MSLLLDHVHLNVSGRGPAQIHWALAWQGFRRGRCCSGKSHCCTLHQFSTCRAFSASPGSSPASVLGSTEDKQWSCPRCSPPMRSSSQSTCGGSLAVFSQIPSPFGSEDVALQLFISACHLQGGEGRVCPAPGRLPPAGIFVVSSPLHPHHLLGSFPEELPKHL